MISEGLTTTKSKAFTDDTLIQGLGTSPSERQRYEAYLFDTHSYYIKMAQRQLGVSETDAIDAYADAVIAVIDQIRKGTFRRESKIGTYLYQIYRNKCLDYGRKNNAKKKKLYVSWSDDFPEIGDSARGALEAFIDAENVKRVVQLLNRMGGTCKELLMYWGEWFSLAEIAKTLKFKDAGSVKSRKYRCLKKLKELYDYNNK